MTYALADVTPWLIWTAKDGWCWWYRKYAPGDTVLEGLEQEARETKKGLWVDPQLAQPCESGEKETGEPPDA